MTGVVPYSVVHTALTITGMHCASCVRHVRTALEELPQVTAEVDLDAATARVSHPPSVPVADLLAAVDEAGYEGAVAAGPR